MTTLVYVLIRKYPENYLDKPGVEEIVRNPRHGQIVLLSNDSVSTLVSVVRAFSNGYPGSCGYSIEQIDLGQL